MIDLHAHILPGFDDGAESLEEAVAMARCACDGGISAVVATPHVVTGLYTPAKEAILEGVEHFRNLLSAKGIPLNIFPGAEYRLEPDLPDRLARGELLTLNDSGCYLLVELPSVMVPGYTNRVVYELLLQGVVPVIAHPERNTGFIKAPSLLYELINQGALSQITAGSLTGFFGSNAGAAARLFLEHGCAQFVASDAHSSTGRVPVLAAAMQEVSRFIGQEEADRLVKENPRRVVRGVSVVKDDLKEIATSRRGFLKRLFSR
ncbi:MAG: Tyrosine-protein phosphatase YwqE [Pelotomaculum sp. PtaB.Bin013]|uniref:protein-tyrosine-phosphatase n=1 Tax=Pelotomaculum isophthalicicum JI TaxID=947010 RepID=A0A9X4H4G6_9FIRM|nr:CpsB/CapC family capsule biosynthesis tyrosine phosphatase [Pelotomaculum isophthalicicum]MDF9406764.1 phosphotransferase [Pelotomaculum isophthalicicum JI]OPX89709.1 MAG: Tyrosine-protein phosphatase YwqE [Pelotomaculum sp. PtaB.Bin013]